MDCYMIFRVYRKHTMSRVTIWGRNAMGAWQHFLEKTKEVLQEKMPVYEEFYENFGIVTNDGTDEPEDDGPGDSFIKAGWLPKTIFSIFGSNNLQESFCYQTKKINMSFSNIKIRK